MKAAYVKFVTTIVVALTITCLLLIISCSTIESRKPSPKIVGEWKLEGKAAEAGIRAAAIGKIGERDYMFLSTVGPSYQSVILVLDINSPENPALVGQLRTIGMEPIGLKLSGNTLFALAMDSIQIIDVSNPKLPREISNFTTRSMFGIPIAVSGKYAYLLSPNNIVILDISDRANPKEKASIKLPERALTALSASDSLLLAVAVNGIHIFDISSPDSFNEVGYFANPNKTELTDHWPQDWFFDVAISGKYAYIASGISGVRVIDLSNPSYPVQIANLETKGVASRILISGNFAYLIDWREALLFKYPLPILIIDISKPKQPSEISSIELPGYFDFNFVLAKEHIYYYGNNPSIKIINIFAKRE